MDILLHDKTLTSQFLMPLLFENKNFMEIVTEYKSFIGAYLADVDKQESSNKIILIFKTMQSNLPELNLINHYTEIINYEVLYYYVYKFNPIIEENYKSWSIGRYSLFSQKAKFIILIFWGAGKGSLLYGVLYKTGSAIKLFHKKHFNTDLDERWSTQTADWWPEPILSEEIYGKELVLQIIKRRN